MSSKKSKNSAKPVPYQINPLPLQDNGAYLVQVDMTLEELALFRLRWNKLTEASGVNAWCIAIPKEAEIEELTTPHLQHLQSRIQHTLKERGAASVSE